MLFAKETWLVYSYIIYIPCVDTARMHDHPALWRVNAETGSAAILAESNFRFVIIDVVCAQIVDACESAVDELAIDDILQNLGKIKIMYILSNS